MARSFPASNAVTMFTGGTNAWMLWTAAKTNPPSDEKSEMREIATIPGICVEIMVHMVEEFVLLGKCWMPSYVHLKPSPLPAVFPADTSVEGDTPEEAANALAQKMREAKLV